MILSGLTLLPSGECLLEIDGKRAASLDFPKVQELGLSEGMELSRELWEEISALSDLRAARESAFRSLAHADFSEAGLARRLREKGVRPEDAERAVQELAEKGYLSDRDFAARMVRAYRDERCFGPRRVREELYRRGVPRELIDELLEGSEYNIDGYCEKKFRSLPRDEKGRRKASAALQRAGYGYEEIRGALARLFDGADDFE